MAQFGIYPRKGTNVRFIFDFPRFDLSRWLTPSSLGERAAQLYLVPERHAAPPALPEPAGGVMLAVPGFSPHLNARIWAAERLDAPLVLLAHDWEGQIQDMMPLIVALTDASARVVAFDAPAHGRSGGDTAHVLSMAAAAVAVAKATGTRIDLAVGHGLGASALVLANLGGFQPARMALLAPMADVSWPMQQIAQAFQLDSGERTLMVDQIDRALGRPLFGLTLQPPAPTIPGLLIHSSDDRVAPVADALHLAAFWPGMHRHLVDGLGHRRLLHDKVVIDLVVRSALAMQGRIDQRSHID
jgi:pimeloyl-ACP methyl ester carboxylesterase